MSHTNIEPDYGTGKKTFGVYLFGTILCLLLTIIPFYMVMHKSMSNATTIMAIYALATVQFLVQVVCFLRLNAQTPQAKANSMSLIFTILITAVIIGGSLWIMWNLDYRMM